MRKKQCDCKNRRGFTLAEQLIVVAIIGVLVAISIPIFAGQRKKAILAVNQANAKAAEEMAAAAYLTDGSDSTVYFVTNGTGSQGSYHPGAGTGYSYPNSGKFYVAWYQRIVEPIDAWTVDTKLRPGKSDQPFCAGDRVAKAWLVTVEYNKDKAYIKDGDVEKNADTTGEFEFAIVALHDGEQIDGKGLRVGK